MESVSIGKKLGIVSLVFVLLVVLIIVSLPLWMPLAVGPVLKRFGVDYDSYERLGYARLALDGVHYTNDRVQVRARRVEAFTPTGWLWQSWRGRSEVDYVAVDDWRVEIEEKEEAPEAEPEEPERDVSVVEIVEQIEDVLPTIIEWAPRARLGSGELSFADRTVDVRGATWREGLVNAEVFDRTLEEVVKFEGDVSGGLPFVLNGRTDPFPLEISVSASRAEAGLAIRSEAHLAGNLLTAEAEFPREGYWPERARLRADDFHVPPDYLDLEGYEEVIGSLLFEWRAGRFTAEVDGRAEPVEGHEMHLPPLNVDASARGDLESFVVETLEIQTPWLVATLSDPVAMNYGGELLTETSVFQLAADLTEQPFVDLRGRVRGDVEISPGAERFPRVEFALTAEQLAGYDVELERVQLDGNLRWPELAVTDLILSGAGESQLAVSANMNLDTLEIDDGRAEGEVWPELVARWLPDDLGFSSIQLAAEFDGPVADLRHGGKVQASEVLTPATHLIDGQVDWEGRMASLSEFALELLAGAGRFTLQGSSEVEENRFGLILDHVRLERDDEPIFESVTESRLFAEWNEEEPFAISLDQLHWTGPGRELAVSGTVAWPERGTFSAKAENLTTALLTDFLDIEPGSVVLSSAEVDGNWEEGPIEFGALAEVRMDVGEASDILFEIDARGEPEQVRVERLRATSDGEPLASAEGILPIAVHPGREPLLNLRESGEIDVRARTDPGAAFWSQVGELTGIFLENPELSLEVTGTPYQPSGNVQGGARLVRLRAFKDKEADQEAPVLEDLRLATVFNEGRIRMEELSLRVEEQLVELEALLPMGTRVWRRLVQEGEMPDWSRASGRLVIPEAEVAAFTRFAPGLLSPQGTLQADVDILPGGKLDGMITLEDAATRPLMPFGSIREATARIALKGRTAHLEEISAVVGGERLLVTGEIEIPFEQPLAFDVGVKGENLPLARRPGVVVRGDLDLRARSEEGKRPIISGRVDLHDSFYVAHLRLMPTGAVATPERRPPFFSIEQEPIADWRLNVDLRGPGFLNVRGPIFQGEISANFTLSGTLEEPRAIGAATIDEGRVRFPFATMTIDQGEIALRQENPFQPQLFIVGSGRTFGYELTLEVTGTAETPVIEFMGNPPVSTEQALLMVTTGEVPRDEIRFTTQQRATRFAVFFGQNLLYQLTGDDAAGDRLVIRSGEQVSEGGRETVSIEYKLTERWSLTGEYDRFDEYNAGVKWNIFSR